MKLKTSSTTPANTRPSVAVAILNWNGLNFLQRFLPSVVEHSTERGEVWIIDNGSSDQSLDWVRSNHPEVAIHENGKNYGFAKGYNIGLQEIEAEFYVLLNSDVEVTADWIDPVIDYMQEANLVACQPKILDHHRRQWFEHAGATGGFIDRNGFVFCAGRIFNAFEEDKGQYDTNKEVFWASGASLFIRSEAYHSVNGLDEDFFAHMEEIDLCWRLKNQGLAVGACGESKVYHVGGGTLDKLNPFKTFLNFRNNLFILVKNYHYGSLTRLIIKRMLLDGVAAFRFLTEGKWSYFTAVFKAHVSFYSKLPLMLRKRKAIRAGLVNPPSGRQAAAPNRKGWYTGSIIREYFLQKKQRFDQLDQGKFL